jgi:hypothetical protein
MPRESRFVSTERVILFAIRDDRFDDSDDRPSFFDVLMESSDAVMAKRDCLSRRRRSLSDLFAFLRHHSDCFSNDSDVLSAWLVVLRDRSDCRRDGRRFHRDGSDFRPGRCRGPFESHDGPAFGALTPGGKRAPGASGRRRRGLLGGRALRARLPFPRGERLSAHSERRVVRRDVACATRSSSPCGSRWKTRKPRPCRARSYCRRAPRGACDPHGTHCSWAPPSTSCIAGSASILGNVDAPERGDRA